jgi:hypothetical protein
LDRQIEQLELRLVELQESFIRRFTNKPSVPSASSEIVAGSGVGVVVTEKVPTVPVPLGLVSSPEAV